MQFHLHTQSRFEIQTFTFSKCTDQKRKQYDPRGTLLTFKQKERMLLAISDFCAFQMNCCLFGQQQNLLFTLHKFVFFLLSLSYDLFIVAHDSWYCNCFRYSNGAAISFAVIRFERSYRINTFPSSTASTN